MSDDDFDSMKAGQRVSEMWRALGEQIAAAIPDIVINDSTPTRAVRWATCAEACFWKATGEADTHDVKDILAETIGIGEP
jgi:hypothetical protein